MTKVELRTDFAFMHEGRRREAFGAALEAVLLKDIADTGVEVIEPWA